MSLFQSKGGIEAVLVDTKQEYSFMFNGVKITHLQFPFMVKSSVWFESYFKMPSILTLSALKAYTLGRGAKWKDYVDLYFVLNTIQIEYTIKKSQDIFGNLFSEKNFRAQLSYFEDIDNSEQVIYMPDFEVKDSVIKETLKNISVQ